MKIPLVDLKSQYLSAKTEIDAAIKGVVNDSAFVGGAYVEHFEKAFAVYLGCRNAIGCGNGTDALTIALICLGIGPGDEVITAANTFIATAEAITAAGAKAVFVDCEEETFNIDPQKIKPAITKKTKAIIPVHLYGQPCNLDKIVSLAKKYHLRIIEDACQAHGAEYKKKKVGTFGDCGCFSFFPSKNLGAWGDGGAIVTNDDELARKIRKYTNHGGLEKYQHDFEGRNSRFDGLQAAVLSVKLKYLDKWNRYRNEIAKFYDNKLAGLVKTPVLAGQRSHVYHQYVIRTKYRDHLQQFLASRGISSSIHYPIPLPYLKAYQYLGYQAKDFPVAYSLKDEILSLPIHDHITPAQANLVVKNIRQALKNG